MSDRRSTVDAICGQPERSTFCMQWKFTLQKHDNIPNIISQTPCKQLKDKLAKILRQNDAFE